MMIEPIDLPQACLRSLHTDGRMHLQYNRFEMAIPTSLRKMIADEATEAIRLLQSGEIYSGLEHTTKCQDLTFGAILEANQTKGKCSATVTLCIKKGDDTLVFNGQFPLFSETDPNSLRPAEDYTSLMIPPTVVTPSASQLLGQPDGKHQLGYSAGF